MSVIAFVILILVVLFIGIVILAPMCDWSGEGDGALGDALEDVDEYFEKLDNDLQDAIE